MSSNGRAATSSERQKWFGVTPLQYEPGPTGFWFRDLGALCVEFRRLGIESQFVVLGRPEKADPGKPLILCSFAELCSPEWWARQKVNGVVLNSWAAPRFTPIVRAIKSSGAKVIVRLDSDGCKSPRGRFIQYLSNTYHGARDVGQALAGPYALVKSLAYRLLPGWHDLKMCEHLELCDVVIIESAMALQHMSRLLLALGRPKLIGKFRVLPHFANVENGYTGATPKKPVILAVGRWNACQKDGGKLIRVLGDVLSRNTEYSAVVVGGGREKLMGEYGRLHEGVRQRIQFTGFLPHHEVQRHCSDSRVMLFASRFEGFPFAASEALCLGCTVVGASSLPSMSHISTCGGGTVATSRADRDLADALAVELMAWDSGWRDPVHISKWWMERVSLRAEARQILDYCNVPIDVNTDC